MTGMMTELKPVSLIRCCCDPLSTSSQRCLPTLGDVCKKSTEAAVSRRRKVSVVTKVDRPRWPFAKSRKNNSMRDVPSGFDNPALRGPRLKIDRAHSHTEGFLEALNVLLENHRGSVTVE